MIKNSIIWIIALILAGITASHAVGSVGKRIAPTAALSSFPANGFVYAGASDAILKSSVIANEGKIPEKIDPMAGKLAKKGFLLEPTAASAVRMVAFDLASQGDQERARALMRMVLTISKRDRIANFWLVDDYGKLDDIDNALKYYDITLRTSQSAAELLLPTMVTALQNDAFVEPFAKLLVGRPPWAENFWQKLVNSRESITNAADLRLRLQKRDISIPMQSEQRLIAQLVRYGHLEEAQMVYGALTTAKKTAGQLVSNADFNDAGGLPPFDWQLNSEGEYGASISPEDGQLLVSAVPGASGVAARQLVTLEPGTYQLSAKIDSGKLDTTRLDAKLRCATSPPANNLVATISLSKTGVEQKFLIPSADCRYYWVDLDIKIPKEGDFDDVILDSFMIVAI